MHTIYSPVINQNPFWKGKRLRHSGIRRKKYLSRLLRECNIDELSALIGVRRSGKSTLMKQIINALLKQGVAPRDILFVNFEEPGLAPFLTSHIIFQAIRIFEDTRSTTTCKTRKYLLFDEIQNVPEWERSIRSLVDSKKYKIFISGSSAKLLGHELATSLSGRYLKTEIFPLDYEEFAGFNKVNHPNIHTFIRTGGFPAIARQPDKELRQRTLADYFESILLRDIASRYNLRNTRALREFSVFLYSNISNIVSIPQFQKMLGLSPDMISRFYEYIETAYLGFFIPIFSQSVKKQIYNPKKFYAIDTGLQQAVTLTSHENSGFLFENNIFLDLRRRFSHNEIFYWKNGVEVDFVIRQGSKITHLINACIDISKAATRAREIRSLKTAMIEFSINRSYIVTLDHKYEEIETTEGIIEVIPWDLMQEEAFFNKLSSD